MSAIQKRLSFRQKNRMFCIGLTLDKRIINVKNISCSCAWHLASISCQCTIYVKILTEACHNLDEKSDKKDANHKKKIRLFGYPDSRQLQSGSQTSFFHFLVWSGFFLLIVRVRLLSHLLACFHRRTAR